MYIAFETNASKSLLAFTLPHVLAFCSCFAYMLPGMDRVLDSSKGLGAPGSFSAVELGSAVKSLALAPGS